MGMSSHMLTYNHFHTSQHSNHRPHGLDNNKAQPNDPRIRNNPRTLHGSSNLASIFKHGSNALSFVIPRLHIFH
jgi:hypothetical protein